MPSAFALCDGVGTVEEFPLGDSAAAICDHLFWNKSLHNFNAVHTLYSLTSTPCGMIDRLVGLPMQD